MYDFVWVIWGPIFSPCHPYIRSTTVLHDNISLNSGYLFARCVPTILITFYKYHTLNQWMIAMGPLLCVRIARLEPASSSYHSLDL